MEKSYAIQGPTDHSIRAQTGSSLLIYSCARPGPVLGKKRLHLGVSFQLRGSQLLAFYLAQLRALLCHPREESRDVLSTTMGSANSAA